MAAIFTMIIVLILACAIAAVLERKPKTSKQIKEEYHRHHYGL